MSLCAQSDQLVVQKNGMQEGSKAIITPLRALAVRKLTLVNGLESETLEVWSASLRSRFDSQIYFRADNFTCATVHAIFQRHAVTLHVINNVDPVHLSGTI